MKAKNKLLLIKIITSVAVPLYFIAITAIFTALGASELWGNMFDVGIQNWGQWFTLVLYRLLLYVSPAFLIAIYKFDKRYKYLSRVIIWLNWTLFIYLLLNAIIKVFALNLLCKKIEVFNSLDGVVALCGYVFTYIEKRKIEFSSSGAIIGEKP